MDVELQSELVNAVAYNCLISYRNASMCAAPKLHRHLLCISALDKKLIGRGGKGNYYRDLWLIFRLYKVSSRAHRM